MTEQEKAAFEQEIREKVAQERREAKAEWRRKNREAIRRYDRNYYLKKKERRAKEGKESEYSCDGKKLNETLTR